MTTPVALDPRVHRAVRGAVLLGGSPWRLTRLSPAAREVVDRMRAAGARGFAPADATGRAVADLLVDRGMAHPVVGPRAATGVCVVVPAYERADLLDACLASIRAGSATVDVVVVDDCSTDMSGIAAVAARHGARLVRHEVNRGPAAGRNTGLAATGEAVVAFVDSDCRVPPGWLDALVPLFDDPRVAAVAPRVRSDAGSSTVLARHEAARSALDMGPHRELVRPGARLGFLPSATLLVRRAALDGRGFDPRLRVGEDVDLVWRLADAGWHVRYEPTVEVHHEARLAPRAWARRRFEYGTSAADLDRRHPGRLAPARVSAWNVAALAAVAAGRSVAAVPVLALAGTLLARRLRDPGLAVRIVGQGVLADAAALGHALRREWWPLGWLALALAPRSRAARTAAAAVLVPIALEWVRTRPDLDPLRYTALRLVEDAAYGSGVLVSAVRGRRWRALLPEVRLPARPGRRTPPVPGR